MYSGNGVLLEFGIIEICDIALQQIVDIIAFVFKTKIFVIFQISAMERKKIRITVVALENHVCPGNHPYFFGLFSLKERYYVHIPVSESISLFQPVWIMTHSMNPLHTLIF